MPPIVIDEALPDLVQYNDGTYQYICTAKPGSALASTVWRVMRVTLATGRIQWAPLGSQAFRYAATDLATVQAIFA